MALSRRVCRRKALLLAVAAVCLSCWWQQASAEAVDGRSLILAEYVEGTGWNKAVALRASQDVDLSQYALWRASNGGDWQEMMQPLLEPDSPGGTTLAAGQTWIVASSRAEPPLPDLADAVSGGLTFNGDDAVGLARRRPGSGAYEVVDVVGVPHGGGGWREGQGWGVLGLEGATRDHTLLRRPGASPTGSDSEAAWQAAAAAEWSVHPADCLCSAGSAGACMSLSASSESCSPLAAPPPAGPPADPTSPPEVTPGSPPPLPACNDWPQAGTRGKECAEAPPRGGDRRPDRSRLRLAAWNIYFLFDGVDDPQTSPWDQGSTQCPLGDKEGCGASAAAAHIERAGAVIARLGADVLGLSEVEDCSVLAKLADSSALRGMGYLPYLVQGTDHSTGQDVALLTKVDPDQPGLQRTSARADTPVRGSTCGFNEVDDTGVSKHFTTTFTLGGRKVVFIQIHLKAFPVDRRSCAQREGQAEVIRQEAATALRDGSEVIIAGDFNDFSATVPGADNDMPLSTVLERLQDVDGDGLEDLTSSAASMAQKDRYTYIYQGDRLQIDHILVSNGLKIIAAWIDHSDDIMPSFDHFPVLVDIELEDVAGSDVPGCRGGLSAQGASSWAARAPWQRAAPMSFGIVMCLLCLSYL